METKSSTAKKPILRMRPMVAINAPDGYGGSVERLGGSEAQISETWVLPQYVSPGEGHDGAALTLDRKVDAPTAEINEVPDFPATGDHEG